MVWSDTVKKTGGLRFLNPSQELQEQVREWLQDTWVTADGRLDTAEVESKAKRRRKKLREEARAEAELARKEAARQAMEAEATARIESENEPRAAKATPRSVGWTDEALRFGERKTVAAWRGLGTMALVGLLLMALITYRRELGHLVMTMGSSIAGDQQKAKAASESGVVGAEPETPAAEASHAVPQAVPDTKETEAEVLPASGSPVAPSNLTNVKTTNEQPAPAKRRGAQVVAAAEDFTTKRSSPHRVGALDDVPRLWTYVEKGDTHAEVALANRYMRGDGVPQSCAQARILLEAAVKRGSAEAKQQLEDLGQAGCP
jgi:hypothetical protein